MVVKTSGKTDSKLAQDRPNGNKPVSETGDERQCDGGQTGPKTTKIPVRQRKSHRKSRLGCSNCKLRGIKCDESKPACKRCSGSGFTCRYGAASAWTSAAAASDLQLAHQGAFEIDLVPAELPAPNPHRRIPVALPMRSTSAGQEGFYELTSDDFAALDRFHRRTVWTMGTPDARPVLVNQMGQLGDAHPYLIHIVITLTLIHDSEIALAPLPPDRRASVALHWYHGTALFKRQLSRPQDLLTSSERDSLWAAAALLGAATMGHIDSEEPTQAWPLKKPAPLDLDWLNMSNGKRAVWALTHPLRSDSVFAVLARGIYLGMPNLDEPIEPGSLPAAFYPVFGLGPGADKDSNPYFVAAKTVSCLMQSDRGPPSANLIAYLAFISLMTPQYKALLEAKDHRALALLTWWFALVVDHEAWWLRRRTCVEGLAVGMYLAGHCEPGDPVLELVAYPMAVFRAARASRGRVRLPLPVWGDHMLVSGQGMGFDVGVVERDMELAFHTDGG